ncbi:MAG: lipid-A-disaccharide synthase, partial [Candidatus Brocadiae bacterium]|nr:lipid-A-disaccharide synthase [Candidatus Brocadiia bacterium]
MAHKRILLSVGDDSGDLHAANLMRAMRELEPGVRFAGFGMAHMAGEGLEPLGEE